MSTTPYSAIAIANYFIQKSLDEKTDDLSPMKLQKLVYFAHAWYLIYQDGGKLINEAIEAWSYGPVINSVYHEFKHNGRNSITEKGSVLMYNP